MSQILTPRLMFVKKFLLETKSIGAHRDFARRDSLLFSATPVSRRAATNAAVTAERIMGELEGRYHRQMIEVIRSYYMQRIDASAMAHNLREMLREYYRSAFALGARASRNPRAVLGFGPTLPEEERFIQRAVEWEHQFLGRLIEEIVRRRPGGPVIFRGRRIVPGTPGPSAVVLPWINRRIANYLESVWSMFEAGKVAAAHPTTTVIHWELRSQSPCPECVLLHDFSPYIKRNLPTTPRAGDTRCLNNCRCTLRIEEASPDEVRMISSLQYAKHYYQRILTRSRQRPANFRRPRPRR